MKKMNINKVCDLKSISVFPPNLRRRSSVEPQLSQPLPQQLRSQHSQQSFSQGPSSQRGSFSQMTQTSLEEFLLNEQRFNSQERDHSSKKNSFLPPISHKRDDSQMAASRSSSGLARRWNSASVGESKSQISEELEQRFGVMETSLSKFGMLLDSIQTDIMQANRGTKQVLLETERMHQKLILHDTSLQQLLKEQADVKASLHGAVKSILEELKKDPDQDNLQKISLMLTEIPEQVETAMQKIRREICHTFSRDIQVLASLKRPEPIVLASAPPPVKSKENLLKQRDPAAKASARSNMPAPRIQVPRVRPQVQGKENLPELRGPVAKSNAFFNTTQKVKQPQLPKNPNNASATTEQIFLSQNIQVGSWKTVKPNQSTLVKRAARKQVKSEATSTQVEECCVLIDSDEDIDGGFSCLLDGNTNGAKFDWDARKETEKLLRSARRTKRKFANPIIIN